MLRRLPTWVLAVAVIVWSLGLSISVLYIAVKIVEWAWQ